MMLAMIYSAFYVVVAIGAVIGIIYFIAQRKREKKEEAEKDYSNY